MRNAALIPLLIISLLSAGCTSLGKGGDDGSVMTLPENYRPLEDVRERGTLLNLVIHGDNTITTVGRSAYVKNLKQWLDERPVGSLRFHAVMRHEQEHSRRQLAYGTNAWLARYVIDKDFALAEEKIGWYWQLKTLKAGGVTINIDGVAKLLSNYKIATGNLISFEEAREWVVEVVTGKWEPPVD